MYEYEVRPEVAQEIKSRLHDWITDVRYADSYDAEGNSVLLVFLVVASQEADRLRDTTNLYKAREIVAEVFKQFDYSFWPYVRFVTEAELQPGLRA